jgi:hypothetical protein
MPFLENNHLLWFYSSGLRRGYSMKTFITNVLADLLDMAIAIVALL